MRGKMNKSLRKGISVIMVATMMVLSLTGCKKSDDELLLKGVAALNSAKSYDAKAVLSGKLKIAFGGNEKDRNIDTNIQIDQNVFVEEERAKVGIVLNSGKGSSKTEAYLEKNAGEYDVYTSGIDGKWKKMVFSDISEAKKQTGIEKMIQLAESIDSYTKKESSNENEAVYEYTLTLDSLKKMSSGIVSSYGYIVGEKNIEKYMDGLKDTKVSATIVVDRENECIKSIEVSLADLLNKVFNEVVKSKMGKDGQDVLKDLKFNWENTTIKTEYSNIDNATKYEVPQDALKTKEVIGNVKEELAKQDKKAKGK
ncbi:MAG: hypothetical protein K6G63_01430 [Eubacterium sp.]|nr:hypothetical protein [Eubacterium sp.]